MHQLFHCGLHYAVHSKKLKKEKKRKKNKGIRQRLIFFFYKIYQKKLRFKSVRSLCKNIPHSLGSSCND